MNRDGKDIQGRGSTGEDWSMCNLPMPWLVRLGAQGLPPSCACGGADMPWHHLWVPGDWKHWTKRWKTCCYSCPCTGLGRGRLGGGGKWSTGSRHRCHTGSQGEGLQLSLWCWKNDPKTGALRGVRAIFGHCNNLQSLQREVAAVEEWAGWVGLVLVTMGGAIPVIKVLGNVFP